MERLECRRDEGLRFGEMERWKGWSLRDERVEIWRDGKVGVEGMRG